MIVRLLVRNIDADDVDQMICEMEIKNVCDVEFEDSYPDDEEE